MGGRDEANAAEAAATRFDHRLQHLLDRRAQRQIGVTDNAGAHACVPVCAAGAHRRDTVGELDLTDRAQFGRTFGTVHRQPLEIDGCGDVVPGPQIGEQFRQQVAARLGPVHQVVMRIDDRQAGVDDLLTPPVEPILPNR
jgi:hypothetical protein